MDNIEDYRVLTLWEPWATLFAHGIKNIETRPKATNWEGIYLIHAAKKWNDELIDISKSEPFKSHLDKLKLGWTFKNGVGGSMGTSYYDFCFGHIIGSFRVSICRDITVSNRLLRNGKPYPALDEDLPVPSDQLPFGDFRDGRSAWIGTDFKLLETPIPYKGGQGYYQKFKGDISELKFKS